MIFVKKINFFLYKKLILKILLKIKSKKTRNNYQFTTNHANTTNFTIKTKKARPRS
jgi:hypothetical protein